MTIKEIAHNTFLGFTTDKEGFSVKKMGFAFIVVNMMIYTWWKSDLNTFAVVLGIWLGFASGLIAVSAVEKNIKATNETKQLDNIAKSKQP